MGDVVRGIGEWVWWRVRGVTLCAPVGIPVCVWRQRERVYGGVSACVKMLKKPSAVASILRVWFRYDLSELVSWERG